ncbi:MAG TPA: hypothetical protein VF334_23565, partial [Polyangia bacterium]
ALAACHRAPSSSSARVVAEPVLSDPQKAVAVRDLRESLAAARAAVQKGQSPVYAADKLMLAAHKLDDAAAHADQRAGDCTTARAMLDRVSGKYKEDAAVLDVVARVKATCPKVRAVRAGSRAAAAPAASGPSREDCRRRCDDAAFDCRARCQYCGSCTTDKTWDQCNAICNTCRQGCEQNEGFCRAACGS